jgi:hypothetical protein
MGKLALVLFRSRVLPTIAALAAATLVFSTASRAQNINQVAQSGPYTFNLKVLPPESFHGPNAAMAHDSGAMAMAENGPEHPNYHLVVFIKKNGKPVENAHVTIAYRQSQWTHWKELPVARMHVAGKGPETTHYGNNVNLAPGKYDVRVKADANSATFRITLNK